MSNAKFEEAKKRLGLKPATIQQGLKPPEQPSDPNIVFDDDGFLVGVKAQETEVKRGYYVLTSGKFKGCPIQYRSLLAIDHLMLKESPITNRMTLLGLDIRNREAANKYLQSLSNIEIHRISIESSKLIVIEAVEKPVLTDAPSERCPPNRISIHDLSLTDIMSIRTGIEDLSGVNEQEETFREADEAGASDRGESEPDGEAGADDSDPDSGDVGESAE